MQYRTFALAFAATCFAQTDLSDEVVSVLATALPSSLVVEYMTNSAAVASEISSAFEAGNTPSWFEALPTEVQTYLVPVVEIGTTSNFTATLTSISGAPTVVVNTTGNSTLATTRRTPSVTSTTSSSDSETTDGSSSDLSSTGGSSSGSDSSSSSSEGGASIPTAIVGMGLAGAAGLAGLWAL